MIGRRPQVKRHFVTIRHFLQFAPIWFLLNATRVIPFAARGRYIGALVAMCASCVPPLRRRAENNLLFVFPDMPKAERRRISIEVARTVGWTLSEILNNDLFAKNAVDIGFNGEGYDAIKKARAEGKGAIIVSAHFGQWEAIRHLLKRDGIDVGAVYKPNSNPFYEGLFLSEIQKGGRPIVESGSVGMMKTVRHVRNGGVFAILADQRVHKGKQMPFLGHPAWTSLAPAELALKYNVPLVPAYATRSDDGAVHVEFEPPVKGNDATDCMMQVLQSLERRIVEKPTQWYWYHNRWAG